MNFKEATVKTNIFVGRKGYAKAGSLRRELHYKPGVGVIAFVLFKPLTICV